MTAAGPPGRSLGVIGDRVHGSLAEALAAGAGWRPLLLLGGLAGAVLSQGVVLLLAPGIATNQGGTAGSVVSASLLWVVGVVVGLPFALRAALSTRRIEATAVGGALISLGLFAASAATGTVLIVVGALGAGVGTVVVGAGHRALLAELYPALALTHVLVAFRALSLAAGALALLLCFPLASAVSLSEQGALLVLAAIVGVCSVATAFLPQPSKEASRAGRSPGFGESMRQMLSISSARPLLGLVAVLAAVGYGIVVFGALAMSQRAGLGQATTHWLLVGLALLGAFALLDRGSQLAALFRQSPTALAARAAAATALAGVATVVVGLVDQPIVMVAALGVAVTALAIGLVAVDRLVLLVVPADLRGVAGALGDTYAALLGVGLGGAVLGGLEGAQGMSVALPALGVVAVAGALVLRAVGRLLPADVAARTSSLAEAAEARNQVASGVRPPLLTCRGINFSYGPLQILFDVDFTVDEGEMVALLGTNGAGKSTLLRVISGLGIPSAGIVRVAGQDVTHAEPGDRVRLGVSQIPGGKAVFGPLSVADNLRLYGYALGRDRAAVDRGIEEALATFPRLQERRNSPSSTLSGGEQQMLALSKALILQPRLLLIDELSLGLAPKVVGELLTLVRSINATGTAVVLVEQSVNVALSLADHAYFMEKGQVRFDGRTEDLLARPDIVRSVFLSGVGG